MSNNGLILLVEDNADLNESNSRVLTRRGYEVQSALTLAEARLKLAEAEPDIILLDVELPDGNGIEFCEEIRDKTVAHILFLTSKIEHENMVLGLKFGGDDYITKPFHLDELLARIDAAMRRRMIDKKPVQTITKGMLTLDIVATQAFIGSEDLALTPKEFSLLLLLVQNEGKVLSAEFVYEKTWNQPLNGDKNSLKSIFSRLRPKIEPAGYIIQSLRGQGYMFVKDDV
jgi:Response regulators consisting of a CheY-like receiver domain and a winged-helix DNA-binding domain